MASDYFSLHVKALELKLTSDIVDHSPEVLFFNKGSCNSRVKSY